MGIEYQVSHLFTNEPGPSMVLLDIESFFGVKIKFNVLEATWVSFNRIREEAQWRKNIANIQKHTLCVMHIDNIETTNHHDILVAGNARLGIHLSEIQVIVYDLNVSISKPI